MAVVIITGAGGLIGSDSVRFFHAQGYDIVGIDNDMRAQFFGTAASTVPTCRRLQHDLHRYTHYDDDIRDQARLKALFKRYGHDIVLVIHAAAQPSHEWAATDPMTDFAINASSTLSLLETTRQYAPEAVFIFASSNKVYGDTPNQLPLVELEERWEMSPEHPYAALGIDETMRIDQSLHSLFGASKLAADIMVQEYGRYFGLKTVAFRGSCLTGPGHRAAELHGFLAYLVACAVNGTHYTVYGHKGKQVRDNIHSHDVVQAFWHYFQHPRPGEVYNLGGSRHANVSILEAIRLVQELGGLRLDYTFRDEPRRGDHRWYISDVRKFQQHYPTWGYTYDIEQIVAELIAHAGQARAE